MAMQIGSLLKRLTSAITRLSKLLILSYLLDWAVIVALAGLGRLFTTRTPYHRPFSLTDLSISFPHVAENVTVPAAIAIVAFAPAIIIFVVCLLCVPGPAISKHTSWGMLWRRKLWELHVGWLGLALCLGLTFLFTESTKNLIGRPRPDLLSRCDPDIDNIAAHVVGDYAKDLAIEWVLVKSSICRSTDVPVLNEGFRSFPSGHTSGSWAGLLYLALFLSSKFAITIPYLPATASASTNDRRITGEYGTSSSRLLTPPSPTGRHSRSTMVRGSRFGGTSDTPFVPTRNRAAAPPLYLSILVIVPIGTAIYISTSRFFDFRHHPGDIFAGAFIGITSAWFSFRWYHMPVRRGAGWAWGPRDTSRAFGIGVGIGSYVTDERWEKKVMADLEMGNIDPTQPSSKYENAPHIVTPENALSFERPRTEDSQHRYENFLADEPSGGTLQER